MDRKKKYFLWIKVILTFISFLCAIIFNHNINCWVYQEICYDISVGVFSAMVLVWFIDEINERIQNTSNKAHERCKILRASKLLDLYIDTYKVFYYCVTTPIENRGSNSWDISKEFTLKDMRDLHKITAISGPNMFDSSIKCFLLAEAELLSEIKQIVRNIDFTFFPLIEEHLSGFIKTSLLYNKKDAILSNEMINAGKEKLSDIVSKSLSNSEAETLYNDIKNGKQRSANLLHPYIFLYEMLKDEYMYLEKYVEEIKNLEK